MIVTVNYILTIGFELSTLGKYSSTSEGADFTSTAHSDLGEGKTSEIFANPRAIGNPEHVNATNPRAADNPEHVYVSIPGTIDNPEHIHIPNPSAIYNPEHVYVTDPTATDNPEHVYASLSEISTTGKSVEGPQSSDKGTES